MHYPKDLNILTFPSEKLKLPGKKIEVFDNDLKKLVNNMFTLMYKSDGAGLAAIQTGLDLQLFVADCSYDKTERLVFINPKITHTEGKQSGTEGCLSFPGLFLKIERPKYVKIEAFDVHGKPFTMDAEDFLARCMHHEMEHLRGEVFLQNLSKLRLSMALNKYYKMIEKTQRN